MFAGRCSSPISLLPVSFSLLTIGQDFVRAEVSLEGYHVCTSDACVTGQSSVQLGARLSSPAILLLPGTYSSASPFSEYLPSGTLIPSLANNSVTFGSSDVANLGGSYSAFDEPNDLLEVSIPGWPIVFGSAGYLGDMSILQIPVAVGGTMVASGNGTVATGNSTVATATSDLNATSSLVALPSVISSIYLPPGTYLISTSTGANNVYRGSIADTAQLPDTGLGFFAPLGNVSYGSDSCSPTCSSGGVCVPSTALLSSDKAYSYDVLQLAGTSSTCACLIGFAGEGCAECEAGFWGPSCEPCDQNCGTCDDGVTGTGGCLGVKGNSTETCKCLHGTCDSPNSCECAAGWATPLSNASAPNESVTSCSVCLAGFYQDPTSGNCLTCPLGATTCASATIDLTCAPTFTLDSTGPCTQQGVNGTCSSGQYRSSTGCAACSAACTTCTGPATTDCLECASPRFSLLGTCVGYDSSTGICASATSTATSSAIAQGVYVANNAKGECDSCPTGCLTCSIPSFSISSTWDQVQCQACHEGWILQGAECVQQCGEGYYLPVGPASINGTCAACDTTICSTCISTATTCLTCATSGQLALSDGSCVSTCPSGTYLSGTSCLACSGDCSTCSGAGPSACLSCPTSAPVRTTAGGCTAVCPVSEYWNPGTSDCAACSTNCTSCTEPASNKCLSCDDGMILKGGSCLTPVCLDANGVISNLGMCFSSLVNDGSDEAGLLWWPFVLSFGLLLIILAIGFRVLVLRQRARRREETGVFAGRLDDKGVMERVRDLVGRGRVGEAKTLEEVLEMERADRGVGLDGGSDSARKKVRFANPFSSQARLELSLPTSTNRGAGSLNSLRPTSPTSPPAIFKPYLSPPSSATIRSSGSSDAPRSRGLRPFILLSGRASGSRESFASMGQAEVPPAYSPKECEYHRPEKKMEPGTKTLDGKRLTRAGEEWDMVDMLDSRSSDSDGYPAYGSGSHSGDGSARMNLDDYSTPTPVGQSGNTVSPRFLVSPPSPPERMGFYLPELSYSSSASSSQDQVTAKSEPDPRRTSFRLGTRDMVAEAGTGSDAGGGRRLV